MKEKYQRSTTYRQSFFKNNKGFFGSTQKYQCVYCGTIKRKKDIQVDHLIPVYEVRKHGMGRFLMKISGIKNINSIKNLVPACERCNKRKGHKMGFWILRGVIGKYPLFWIIIWIIRIIFFSFLLFFIYQLYKGNIEFNIEKFFSNFFIKNT